MWTVNERCFVGITSLVSEESKSWVHTTSNTSAHFTIWRTHNKAGGWGEALAVSDLLKSPEDQK